MGSRSTTHNDPPETDQRKIVQKQVERAEFGRRLNAALVKVGWTQSDLARAAEKRAPKGTRIGTDSISHYINGRYMPRPSHLKIIAEVLGVEPRDLLPAKGAAEVGDEKLPPINVQDLNDGTAWLRINQAVPWSLAVKILGLLRGEEE